MKPKARINLGSNTSQSFSLFVKGLSTTDLLSCFSSIRDSIHLLLSRRYKLESVQYLNFKSDIKFHIWCPIISSSQNSCLFVISNEIDSNRFANKVKIWQFIYCWIVYLNCSVFFT